MPELPEVEICRRNLVRWTGDTSFLHARVHDPRSLKHTAVESLKEAVRGRRALGWHRHGKRIVGFLEGGPALCLHLGMTGKWVRRSVSAELPPFARVSFLLASQESLHFLDPRLLGGVEVREAGEARAWLEKERGPDALLHPPDGEGLGRLLRGTTRSIKVALMDQAVLAGLGNIQAAEILWEAGISPLRPARELAPSELAVLAMWIPRKLQEVIDLEEGEEIAYVEEAGAPNPFQVYGKKGSPCPRCQAPLCREVQGGRSTWYCRSCQK